MNTEDLLDEKSMLTYAICGSNDNNFSAIVQSIHQGQQSRYNRGMYLVVSARTYRCQSVNLVEKYDRGAHQISLVKQKS